ncbi:MAG: ABC transporter transmembrane domain-containing protein, partial [Ruminococcus sp.]
MSNHNRPPRGGHGGGPGGGMPVEKAKDFKGSMGKLLKYIGRYKIAIVIVGLCAVVSTVFSVVSPKVLGNATTELAKGIMSKIQGTGGIDLTLIGQILMFVLCLYLVSTIFQFLQGWIMTSVTQKVCYRLRRDISEKINRMPLKYFESRTYGEVL